MVTQFSRFSSDCHDIVTFGRVWNTATTNKQNLDVHSKHLMQLISLKIAPTGIMKTIFIDKQAQSL